MPEPLVTFISKHGGIVLYEDRIRIVTNPFVTDIRIPKNITDKERLTSLIDKAIDSGLNEYNSIRDEEVWTSGYQEMRGHRYNLDGVLRVLIPYIIKRNTEKENSLADFIASNPPVLFQQYKVIDMN